MKKLERLKLHNIEEINVDDQKTLKGGGVWVWDDKVNAYCYIPGYIIEYSNGDDIPVLFVPVDESTGTETGGRVSLMEFVTIATSAILSGSAGLSGGPVGSVAAFWSTALGGWIAASQD